MAAKTVKIENKMLGKELIEIAIGDFYMYDEATGLEYCTTSLSNAEFSSSADKTDVRGGVNNAVLYTIPGEKEVTFTITDVVNHVDITALKNASSIQEVDSKEMFCYHVPKFYNITIETTNAKVTLDQEPIAGEKVMVYLEDGTLVGDTKVSLTGKELTITNTDLNLTSADKVRVMGFKYKVDAKALYYTISAEGTTTNLIGVYKKPVFNRKTMKIEYYKVVYYPQVTMDANYTESDSTTREAVSEEHSFTITKKDTEDVLGYVYYEPVE